MTRDDIIEMAGQVHPLTKVLLDKGLAQGMKHETFVWFLERFADILKARLAEPDTDCHAQGICQRSGYSIGQSKPLTETSAERTLKRMGYTDCGGQFWKPPLGAPAQPQEPVQGPKPLSYADALRIATEAIGRLKSAGPAEGLVGLVRAVEAAHGIGKQE